MKKNTQFSISMLSIFSFLLFTLNSCSPVFSELQDARLVGKNNLEATAGFSTISNDGNSIQNEYGIQAAYGLSDNFDARIRYVAVNGSDNINNLKANILSFGPKLRLIENRLSVYVPVGFAFGKDLDGVSDTWQIHPTLLGTIPVVDQLDINPSFKFLFPFKDDADALVAFNLGLGVKVLDGFTIRPEFGMLFDPGESGNFKQFSIGITYFPNFDKSGK